MALNMEAKNKGTDLQCPICESRELARNVSDQLIRQRDGSSYLIRGYEYTDCLSCGQKFVLSSQANKNDDRLQQEKADRVLDSKRGVFWRILITASERLPRWTSLGTAPYLASVVGVLGVAVILLSQQSTSQICELSNYKSVYSCGGNISSLRSAVEQPKENSSKNGGRASGYILPLVEPQGSVFEKSGPATLALNSRELEDLEDLFHDLDIAWIIFSPQLPDAELIYLVAELSGAKTATHIEKMQSTSEELGLLLEGNGLFDPNSEFTAFSVLLDLQ